MVLPIYEEIMSAFEEARKRHPTAESQRSRAPTQDNSPLSSPRSTPSPDTRRITRSSQAIPITTISACRNNPSSHDNDPVAEEQSNVPQAEGVDISAYTDVENHFSTNVNLGWQKLDSYYKKTDETPIYRVAVVLHPRMKWHWINRHWGKHQDWVTAAHKAVEGLWEQYKVTNNAPSSAAYVTIDDGSESDDDDTYFAARDQYAEYVAEPRPLRTQMTRHDSPIPYWISKLTVWPELAKMALDIYCTPPMSDEPERVFSIAGNTLNARRRVMTEDTVQELLCLRSWQRSGLVQFDHTTFEKAVQASQDAPIADELAYNNTIDLSIEGDDDS
jgi:hypothetical protein